MRILSRRGTSAWIEFNTVLGTTVVKSKMIEAVAPVTVKALAIIAEEGDTVAYRLAADSKTALIVGGKTMFVTDKYEDVLKEIILL